jgi:hypothetical protein
MTNDLSVAAPRFSSLALQGIEFLSPHSQDALGRTGAYLCTLDPDVALPPAYEIFQRSTSAVEDPAPEAYRSLIKHIARMSRLGLKLEQIADRLALPYLTLREAEVFLPDVRVAMKGGLAAGVENAATRLQEQIDLGDVSATSLFLKTRGGWQPPPEGPLVQINNNIGQQIASVSVDPINAMAARQRALLEECDYDDI